jgi:hypothetical protein
MACYGKALLFNYPGRYSSCFTTDPPEINGVSHSYDVASALDILSIL